MTNLFGGAALSTPSTGPSSLFEQRLTGNPSGVWEEGATTEVLVARRS